MKKCIIICNGPSAIKAKGINTNGYDLSLAVKVEFKAPCKGGRGILPLDANPSTVRKFHEALANVIEKVRTEDFEGAARRYAMGN